jgi:hypothetical protein
MIRTPATILFAFATLLPLGTTTPALADGPALVTVSGSVANANRGPIDQEIDKLFAFNDVTFEKAREFDFDALEALPQVKVRADFPRGGRIVEFEGPKLADVLAAAGAEGGTVTIRAMDGYAVEVPMSEMMDKGAVVALKRDGKELGIGGFGPTQVVFPRAERDDLADMPDDWWIWSIYHIAVE